MIFLLLNFLIAFLAFVAFWTVLFSLKKQKNSNYYFLIILFFLFFQRSLYSIVFLFKFNLSNNFFNNAYFAYIIIPIFFLFIKKYIGKTITKKENIFHFTIGLFLFTINSVFEFKQLLQSYLYFIFSTCYVFISALTFLKFYKSNNRIEMEKSKKQWLFIMLLLVLSVIVLSNLVFFKNSEIPNTFLPKFYDLTAIIWLISLIYLFVNPKILFGKERLKHIINSEEIALLDVWQLKPNGKITPKDKKLHENIAQNASYIIKKIENYVNKYYLNHKEVLDFDTLARGIKIQNYHLNYIFKYYCVYTKNDYFNYCKIMHALDLIEKGYLNNKTINSLLVDCHFNSRKTFYTNFKKFTKKKPNEINKILQFKE
jgi:AraC-like DNA-binding protein